MKRIEQRTSTSRSRLQTLFGRPASNITFDGVQLRDAPQGLGGQRRIMPHLQIVELAPHVRPAGRFLDLSALIEMMEPGVGVRLQSAAEPAQVLARMLAAPI